MICFESTLPSLSTQFVRNGAEVIVYLVNDGWYEHPPEPQQHAKQSIFRAIENRRAVLRCANTGISIGAALGGVRSVVVHQRLDFFLLAMDQLVNAASKWHYMFGSKKSIPITIRLIVGRGWGQGPTHSQSLQSVFAHIPGLKVVIPSSPQSAYDLLLSSIFDPNPVVYLEHRWLHNLKAKVSEKKIIKLEGSNILKSGKDVTIITMSFAVTDVLDIAERMSKENIHIEVIDLSVIKPIFWKNILKSVKKTGRMILIDTGVYTGSVSSEIISEICIKHQSILKPNCEMASMTAEAEGQSLLRLIKGQSITLLISSYIMSWPHRPRRVTAARTEIPVSLETAEARAISKSSRILELLRT